MNEEEMKLRVRELMDEVVELNRLGDEDREGAGSGVMKLGGIIKELVSFGEEIMNAQQEVFELVATGNRKMKLPTLCWAQYVFRSGFR